VAEDVVLLPVVLVEDGDRHGNHTLKRRRKKNINPKRKMQRS